MLRAVQRITLGLLAFVLAVSPISGQDWKRNVRFGKPVPEIKLDAREDAHVTCKQYVLSYNGKKNIANWVSWHLTKSDIGDATRGAWESDDRLPMGFDKVVDSTYDKCGFDRGHMCPSEDRSNTDDDNDITFILSNAIPQSPNNNRKGWRMLEAYCQRLALEGNDLHIVCGPHGQRGEGTIGFANFLVKGNVKLHVPAVTWKVILVLPSAKAAPTKRTRTIAVIMPNDQSVTTDWAKYRCSIDHIEELTGYKFFPEIQNPVADIIKKRVDEEPIGEKIKEKKKNKKNKND